MYTLNDKIRNLVPYDPIAGEYKIRLDANESYFSMENELMERIKAAAETVAYNRYPDPTAKKLRDCYAALYDIPADRITCGNALIANANRK